MGILLQNTILTTRQPSVFSTRRTLIPYFDPSEVPAGMQFNSCVLQCVPNLPVFTDTVGTDGFKNDFSSFFVKTAKGATIRAFLINTKTGEKHNLLTTPGLYGEQYDFISPVRAYAYKINWFDVWFNHGFSTYQITIEVLNIAQNPISSFISPCYDLKKYSDLAANGTVRIETLNSNILKHGNNYKNLKVLGSENIIEWCQQWRVFGSFSLSGLPRENDRVKLTSRTSYQIKDEIIPEYDLVIKRITAARVNPIIFDGMFSNVVKCVDYNVLNYENFQEVEVFNQSINLNGGPTVNRTKKSFTFKMIQDKQNIFSTNN